MLINDNTGKEFVIPEKGNNLTKITGLTASECRSIFVIRNSDLNIGSTGFYIEVADKLVGLRTSDLVSIKERLREIAKITPKDSFTNQDGQLKSRLDSCSSLLETIDSLLEEAKSYDVDTIEVENVHLSDELSRIQQEAELLESARKREKYEKGISALSKLETSKQAYSKVETFDERDEQTWRDAERDIETLEGQKTGLATEINKLKEDLSSVTTDLESKKAHFTAFQTAKKRIDEEIRPELEVMLKS
jgi:chromosome segregation ATPase